MRNLLLFVSLLAASLTANAATFQGSTSGTFENPTGPSGMVTTGVGTNEFTWGEGATQYFWFIPVGQEDPSKLKMTGTGFNVDTDQKFIAGYLNFYNGVINAGTQADSVDLSLTLNFTSPSLLSETFTIGFSLDNVVNPNGDTVTYLNSVPTKFLSYGGMDYYFQLTDFGIHTKKGIKLVDEIFLSEKAQTTAKLIGQFTAMPSEVPLPAAVWLFGSGLMGFMAMRRRAKAQQA